MMDNSYCEEEMKMVNETRKIFGDPNIRITATCVRVPVLRAHSEAINLEFEQPLVLTKPERFWLRRLESSWLKISQKITSLCPSKQAAKMMC